jgi:DNA-binding FadR family transcriptional regulator
MSESGRPTESGTGRLKLAEQTAAKIERSILERGWQPGTVLGSEADLLAGYGVSRAVLREAVRLLEHDNIAYMRRGPGGGLVVAAPDATAVTRAASRYLRDRAMSPALLVAARVAIEHAAVRSTTESIDEQGIKRLRDVLAAEEALGQQLDVSRHDFHLTVAQMSGNPAVEMLAEVLTALSTAAFGKQKWADVHSAHEGIAEAIVAGDFALAQNRMTRHLQKLAEVAGQSTPSRAARRGPATTRPRGPRRRGHNARG